MGQATRRGARESRTRRRRGACEPSRRGLREEGSKASGRLSRALAAPASAAAAGDRKAVPNEVIMASATAGAGLRSAMGRAGIEPATLGLKVRSVSLQRTETNGNRLQKGTFRVATIFTSTQPVAASAYAYSYAPDEPQSANGSLRGSRPGSWYSRRWPSRAFSSSTTATCDSCDSGSRRP